jgi:hypothetical protein
VLFVLVLFGVCAVVCRSWVAGAAIRSGRFGYFLYARVRGWEKRETSTGHRELVNRDSLILSSKWFIILVFLYNA